MDLFSVLDPDGLSTDMDSLFTEEFACITPSSKISTLSKYVPVPDQLPVDQEVRDGTNSWYCVIS
uniref:Putative pheromone Mr_Ph3 n=1 Tax=Moniliophthora roreri TaxID=221103 RepID=A0A0W0FBV1_MONRR